MLSFIVFVVENSQRIARELSGTDEFLKEFVELAVRNLEKHGFTIKSVRTERDEEGEEYTVIQLEKHTVVIRNTLMCGDTCGHEFLVEF